MITAPALGDGRGSRGGAEWTPSAEAARAPPRGSDPVPAARRARGLLQWGETSIMSPLPARRESVPVPFPDSRLSAPGPLLGGDGRVPDLVASELHGPGGGPETLTRCLAFTSP